VHPHPYRGTEWGTGMQNALKAIKIKNADDGSHYDGGG
jgi:hypothetical protein